ncbi:S-phase kinase-associated protein 1-like [Cynocephalus volans]|uniref:S-phase kinase-associated protein 1-like n=1 Tax=Cynocephalus volans TaxID=110931 RepID=UPI002FCC68C3
MESTDANADSPDAQPDIAPEHCIGSLRGIHQWHPAAAKGPAAKTVTKKLKKKSTKSFSFFTIPQEYDLLEIAPAMIPNTLPSIKLQSSDGEVFEVDVEIAKQSVTIETMMEDLGMDNERDHDPVPLLNVNAAILRKVLQWCVHHKDDAPPPEDGENKEKRTDDIPAWDQEFLEVDQGTLLELILAANYLDIKGLLDVTGKTFANMTKEKTPEEIHKIFNIKNDFTEEEEAQVRKENQCHEEK